MRRLHGRTRCERMHERIGLSAEEMEDSMKLTFTTATPSSSAGAGYSANDARAQDELRAVRESGGQQAASVLSHEQQ